MMFELRPYQREAVEAVYRYLREHDDNPACVLPTGAGKSVVLGQIAKDAVTLWQGRVLVLAHVQELLEQNADKIQRLCPELAVGVYSAGLKRRDTLPNVICGGIQSCYKRASELGHFDLAIVDECHLITDSESGMYRSFLSDLKATNPGMRVIGLTATPFRMTTGSICAPENILNAVCYEVGVRELIVNGYLCPLVTKAAKHKVDTSELHVRGGDFLASEVEDLMDDDEIVESACREITDQARERRSVLIFASGVQHGNHVAKTLERMGQKVATVFGDTLDFQREQTLADFKSGKLKYLVNVNVLTTGFDAPNIDCVAMLRPTMSPGLWYQCCGRGFRLHPSKKDCLILDFGGNAMRHGPVDAIRMRERGNGEGDAPAKECPVCRAVIACGYTICPHCGHEFEREKSKHAAKASEAGVLSGQVSTQTYPVEEVAYFVHQKRGANEDSPRTMRVDYKLGFNRWQSEWICFEHDGFARQKAESWWQRRSTAPVPTNSNEAVALASAGALCSTTAITVRSVAGEKYDTVISHELGPAPEPIAISACPDCGETDTFNHGGQNCCVGCGATIPAIDPIQQDHAELAPADEVPF